VLMDWIGFGKWTHVQLWGNLFCPIPVADGLPGHQLRLLLLLLLLEPFRRWRLILMHRAAPQEASQRPDETLRWYPGEILDVAT